MVNYMARFRFRHDELIDVRWDQHHDHVTAGVVDHGNLSGVLPDQHHSQSHASSHVDGGADEITTPLDLGAIPDNLTGKNADKLDGAHGIEYYVAST